MYQEFTGKKVTLMLMPIINKKIQFNCNSIFVKQNTHYFKESIITANNYLKKFY